MAHPDVDTDARDTDGKTVLHLAADNSSLEVLEALVDSGKFDIRARGPEFGVTALHFATCMEDDEPSAEKVGMSCDFEPILVSYLRKPCPLQIAYLITKGCDPNAMDKNGMTTLHFLAYGTRNAEIQDFLDAIQELIYGGADVNAKNKRGETPLNVAVKESAVEIVEQLLHDGTLQRSTFVQF